VQRIPNIGLKLKIIIDQIKDVQVIVSGSSAFDINNLTQEPLTGRKLSIICILSLGVNLKIVLVT
jgi:predicted AAA+ superfamily ATPase